METSGMKSEDFRQWIAIGGTFVIGVLSMIFSWLNFNQTEEITTAGYAERVAVAESGLRRAEELRAEIVKRLDRLAMEVQNHSNSNIEILVSDLIDDHVSEFKNRNPEFEKIISSKVDDYQKAVDAQLDAYSAQQKARTEKIYADLNELRDSLESISQGGNEISVGAVAKALVENYPNEVRGPIGPRGPAGPKGEVGPKGDAGPKGDPGESSSLQSSAGEASSVRPIFADPNRIISQNGVSVKIERVTSSNFGKAVNIRLLVENSGELPVYLMKGWEDTFIVSDLYGNQIILDRLTGVYSCSYGLRGKQYCSNSISSAPKIDPGVVHLLH